MPTKNDVIALAHRHIGVLSADEVPTAEQNAYAEDVLDAIYDELISEQGIPVAWTLASVPQKALMGLSQALASDIAGHYSTPYQGRSRGIARLRAALISDDRVDSPDFADAFIISQGQTSPVLTYYLEPATVSLAGASVVFNMRDVYGSVKINGASATIVTATVTPTVSYTFTAANTDTVGQFIGDFVVTYADTTTETFPNLVKIPILVTDPLGGTQDLVDPLGDYF